MYFFLNNTSFYLASVIEHAEYARLRLFKQHGVDAKILTQVYQLDATDNLIANHVDPDDCINMIDYFCDNVGVTPRALTVDEVYRDSPWKRVGDGSTVHFYQGNWETRRVYTNQGNITKVEHFDGDQQLVRRDRFDSRGFRAKSEFYATTDDPQAALLTLEQYYSSTGRVGFETSYRSRNNAVVSVNHRIQLADGRSWAVFNLGQAMTVFLDLINMDNGGHNTFISDRSNITNQPMIEMTTPARKIEHFHNIHFADPRDPMNSALTYPSIAETNRLAATDMIITPTAQQADDMRRRLKTDVPIADIPVGYVPGAQLQNAYVPMTDARRIKGNIIIVARLSKQKNLSEAILAFAAAHEQLDWLTLNIYGYGDSEDGFQEENKLRALVQEKQLAGCVHFNGYTRDMAAVYQSAQMLLMTSEHEGFVLALLEAASFGVPQLSYDSYYGPAHVIRDGQSGYVVRYGDRPALTQHILEVMRDPELLQTLSDGAYSRAEDFSDTAVWQRWQDAVIRHDGERGQFNRKNVDPIKGQLQAHPVNFDV